MDKRLQDIIDNFEKMRIGADDSFRFHCVQCGKCCIHREDILLTPRDIYNLSKELGMLPEIMSGQYCEVYVGQDSRVPIVRLKPRGQIKRCPLLKDRKCIVHKSKPAVCAMYPIGRCLMADSSNESHREFCVEDTIFLFTGAGCGDGSKSQTVRQWLEAIGISVKDQFFVKWQNIVINLSGKFRKMEKTMGMDTMQAVWSAYYAGLYLHYDTKKDFLPQFEENAEKYLEALHTAF